MLLHLITNDIVLTRKYLLVLLAVGIILPFGLASDSSAATSMPGIVGIVTLLLMCVYSGCFCLSYLMSQLRRHHSALALLCVTPYSRSQIVVSTYLFGLLVPVAACLLFCAETLFVPSLRGVTPLGVAAIAFTTLLTISVYLPLVYRFGYDATRLVIFLAIGLFPFLSAYLDKYTTFWRSLLVSAPVLTPLLWTAGVVLYILSMWLSIRIFRKKELS